MAMSGDEVRRLMLGWARPELLANTGANPVRDLKRAYRKHRKLLASTNDLVALKAVELYDKRYGTLAPPPEIDRTPRFAVQINLEQPKAVVEALPAVEIPAKAIAETTTGRGKRHKKSTT